MQLRIFFKKKRARMRLYPLEDFLCEAVDMTVSKMSLRKIVLAEFAAHARSFEDEQKIFKFEVSRFTGFGYTVSILGNN